MVKIWLRKRSIVDNFLFGAADRQNQSTKWIDDLHIKNFQSCFIFVIGSYGIHNNMNSHKLLEYPIRTRREVGSKIKYDKIKSEVNESAKQNRLTVVATV